MWPKTVSLILEKEVCSYGDNSSLAELVFANKTSLFVQLDVLTIHGDDVSEMTRKAFRLYNLCVVVHLSGLSSILCRSGTNQRHYTPKTKKVSNRGRAGLSQRTELVNHYR